MAIDSKIEDLPNEAAKGVSYYTPAQDPPAGTALNPQPNGKPLPKLFQPIKIRGLELQNRIVVSPLCQYSAADGEVTPWHMAHLGGIFTRGPGLTFVEASAVVPEGRITPEDAGIWDDKHIAAWRPIVEFAHSQGQKIGIQLAHSGRKGSAVAPWLHIGMIALDKNGGWTDKVYGPSEEPWDSTFARPHSLKKDDIKGIVKAFADGARRALAAGFDVIEIHNAHGYLLNSFTSPAVNKRTDEYGGSFENRIRFSLEVVDAVREVIPQDMPLWLRNSATDWLEEAHPDEPHWTPEDAGRFALILADHGVDVFDVSSGGAHKDQKVPKGSTQSLLSKRVREIVQGRILVSAVGGIRDGKTAEQFLQEGRADIILVGRHFQKNPGTVWQFADDLDVTIYLPKQIGWGFGGRGSSTSKKMQMILGGPLEDN